MRTLAEIVVATAEFFEFSPDDVIDPDDAVKKLEEIAYYLERASEEEKQAVLAICRARLESLDSRASPEVRQFYERFGWSFGFLPDEGT